MKNKITQYAKHYCYCFYQSYIIRETNKDSSTVIGNELNQKDVETVLMKLFSPNSTITYPSSKETLRNNSERSRGGYTEDGFEGKATDYVSERTMDVLLREMRKTDRDRDRVLHPIQIKTLFSKYMVYYIVTKSLQ